MDFTDLRVLKTQERLQNALLELLKTKELKAITVKEICDNAGISRNAFYQHYGYKEDLYEQMVARVTERIRESLNPIIPDLSHVSPDAVADFAKRFVDSIAEVKELIRVMLKSDDGRFLRQLTDLMFGQNLSHSIERFGVEDSEELRLYYEFLSAGMAAFVLKWVSDDQLSARDAGKLLTNLMLLSPTDMPNLFLPN